MTTQPLSGEDGAMNRSDDVPARVALFFGWARSPLWYRTGEQVGDVDLDSLPISAGLRERLRQWNDHADSILSSNAFEWPDEATEAQHVATGSALAQAVRDELGTEVIYTPDGNVDEPMQRSVPPQEQAGEGWCAYAPLSSSTFRPRRRWPEDQS